MYVSILVLVVQARSNFHCIYQLNEALGGGAGRGGPEIPEARATVDYTETRGPGDEAWADT